MTESNYMSWEERLATQQTQTFKFKSCLATSSVYNFPIEINHIEF